MDDALATRIMRDVTLGSRDPVRRRTSGAWVGIAAAALVAALAAFGLWVSLPPGRPSTAGSSPSRAVPTDPDAVSSSRPRTSPSVLPSAMSTPTSAPSFRPSASLEPAFGQGIETTVRLPVLPEPGASAPSMFLESGQGAASMGRIERVGGQRYLLVQVPYPHRDGAEWIFGWIQGSVETGEFFASKPWSCNEPTFVAHLSGDPMKVFLCYAGRPIEVSGRLRRPFVTEPIYTGTPRWLGPADALTLQGFGGSGAEAGAVDVAIPPELSAESFVGKDVTVVGSFGDPRASSCRREPTRDGFLLEDRDLSRTWCEQRFVLTEIRPYRPGD